MMCVLSSMYQVTFPSTCVHRYDPLPTFQFGYGPPEAGVVPGGLECPPGVCRDRQRGAARGGGEKHPLQRGHRGFVGRPPGGHHAPGAHCTEMDGGWRIAGATLWGMQSVLRAVLN